jgi:hypothetical protein
MHIIDSDDETSWPEALVNALEPLTQALRAFHDERRRIDLDARNDVMLRIYRPCNPYEASWNRALELADAAIAGHRLLGFHATRLTLPEQKSVASSGLKVLSSDLFEARLSSLEADRLVTGDQAKSLRSRHQVLDDNRSGMTWFCFNRSSLCDEDGISRLFRSWGGEALYNSHEDDVHTGPILRRIGEPCIVVAAVPIESIETFMTVGNRLLNAWASRRNILIPHQVEFEGYSRFDTSAGNVVRIVTFRHAEFLALTCHDQWDEPLT